MDVERIINEFNKFISYALIPLIIFVLIFLIAAFFYMRKTIKENKHLETSYKILAWTYYGFACVLWLFTSVALIKITYFLEG